MDAIGVRRADGSRSTTILKFVPLAIIGVIGLFYMTTASHVPRREGSWAVTASRLEGITAAIGLTLWAFIGLESATVPRRRGEGPEADDPAATPPGKPSRR